MIAALLVACTPEPRPTPPTPTPGATTLTGIAEAAGFTVSTGAFRVADIDACCDPDASCLWNNASTPYDVYRLPGPDGDATTGAGGLIDAYHLRADEALVFLGATPPASKYFSFRSYLTYRTLDGALAPVLGSLGPSLNGLVIADRLGGDIADQPLAIVTSADAAVERAVIGWLVRSGWDADHVFTDRLPYSLLRLGLDDDDDLISVVSRAAVFDDPAAGDAWRAGEGATVLRLTPSGPEAPPAEPFAPEALPPMGSGLGEDGWRDAVDRLEDAIVARYPGFVPFVRESNDWVFDTYGCIADAFCSGEIRDRYYARVPGTTLPDDGSFIVALGVNHERTGKASYANVSVETVENQIGLEAVESDRFVGSARAFVPGDPQVDDLYAVVVARDCAPFDGLPCMAVATTCPGVPLDEPLVIDFRAYLEPATGSAPIGSELVRDRAIKFVPLPAPGRMKHP